MVGGHKKRRGPTLRDQWAAEDGWGRRRERRRDARRVSGAGGSGLCNVGTGSRCAESL